MTIFQGPITHQKTVITSLNNLRDTVRNFLLACGWLLINSNTKAWARFIFNTNPANNETVSIVFTYKFVTGTPAAGQGQVKIGASATDTAQNLTNALNAGPGAGTTYSSGTTANPSVDATYEGSGSVIIRAKTANAGFGGNGLALSNGSSSHVTMRTNDSNGSNTNAILCGGGEVYECSLSVQNLKCRLLVSNDATRLLLKPLDSLSVNLEKGVSNFATGTSFHPITVYNGTTYRFRGGRHQIEFWTVGSDQQYGSFFCGIPVVPRFLAPNVVLAATAGSPIALTLKFPHSYPNGSQVDVEGGQGLAGLNGIYTIQVVDSLRIKLIGATGTGTYIPESASIVSLVAPSTGYAELAWAASKGTGSGFRTRWETIGNAFVTAITGSNYWVATGNAYLALGALYDTVHPAEPLPQAQYMDGAGILFDSFLAWGTTGPTDTPVYFGMPWDCFGDTLPYNSDSDIFRAGHDWVNVMDNNIGKNSISDATLRYAPGSLFLAID